MCKKRYSITSIIIMFMYVITEIMACFIGDDKYVVIDPAVMYMVALGLLTVLTVLNDKMNFVKSECGNIKKYRTISIICTVLLVLVILCALIYSIVNVFFEYWSYDWYGYILVFGINIGLVLINSDKNLFVNKVTSCLALIVLALLSIDYNSSPFSSSSVMLVCLAVSVNLLAPRMGKKIQLILSLASPVILIMPIIYLIRGYWGVNSIVFVKAISIVAVLLSFVCTVIGAVLDIKKCKGEKPVDAPVPVPDTPIAEDVITSAPVATPVVNLVATETWTCEKCGANNNGDFCENCGAKKTEYWFCTSCGTKNHKLFCGKCGQKREM